MTDKGTPLPKFGEWDVNDPASAEGFTVIFNKARDEKKTGGKPDSPENSQSKNVKSGIDQSKKNGSAVSKLQMLNLEEGKLVWLGGFDETMPAYSPKPNSYCRCDLVLHNFLAVKLHVCDSLKSIAYDWSGFGTYFHHSTIVFDSCLIGMYVMQPFILAQQRLKLVTSSNLYFIYLVTVGSTKSFTI
ncbi:hypothetical protein V2J09_015194 [Rumex salicifolius]